MVLKVYECLWIDICVHGRMRTYTKSKLSRLFITQFLFYSILCKVYTFLLICSCRNFGGRVCICVLVRVPFCALTLNSNYPNGWTCTKYIFFIDLFVWIPCEYVFVCVRGCLFIIYASAGRIQIVYLIDIWFEFVLFWMMSREFVVRVCVCVLFCVRLFAF